MNDLNIPAEAATPIVSPVGFTLPDVIADRGDKAAERFFSSFTDTITVY